MREKNYDLLRIISCLAVICIHVTSIYKGAITNAGILGEVITTNIPIMIRWKRDIDRKTFEKAAAVLMLICIFSGWTSEFEMNWGIAGFSYLGYFLLGYLLRERYGNKKNTAGGLLLIAGGVAVEMVIFAIQYQHILQGINEGNEKYTLVGPLNPLVALASVLVFAGFSMLKIEKGNGLIASKTFLVYMIHGVVLDVGIKFIGKINHHYSYIIIPAAVIAVALVSYVLGIIYETIWKWLEDRFRVSEKISYLIVPTKKG